MTLKRSTYFRIELVAIAVVIVGGILLFFVTQNGPQVIDQTYGESHVNLSLSRRWLALPGECVTVSWDVQGIREISYNGVGATGVEEREVCLEVHREFQFEIVFPDGEIRTYELTSRILLLYPITWFLLLIAAIALFEARSRRTTVTAVDPQGEANADHSRPIYFPGLNGIRFLAAFTVIISHTWQFQRDAGFSAYSQTLPNTDMAKKSVTMFFVLSGFLITYLLLAEYRKTGGIQVREFYIRRFLRIWPLYYLLVALGFFVLPHLETFERSEFIYDQFALKLALYGLLLPNIASNFSLGVLFISHTWSIGVEEQFYLLWPQLMKRFVRHIPMLLAAVIIVKWLAVRILFELPNTEGELVGEIRRFGINFFGVFQIESMALGGVGAYVLFHKKQALRLIFHPVVERAALVLVPVMMLNDTTPLPEEAFLLAIVFSVFILNTAANPNALIRLENRPFNYLGKISYGLYMYHPMVIILSLVFLRTTPLAEGNFVVWNLVTYTVSIGGTIALAAISYRFYESWFLRLKHRFTRVPSGVRADSSTVSL